MVALVRNETGDTRTNRKILPQTLYLQSCRLDPTAHIFRQLQRRRLFGVGSNHYNDSRTKARNQIRWSLELVMYHRSNTVHTTLPNLLTIESEQAVEAIDFEEYEAQHGAGPIGSLPFGAEFTIKHAPAR